MAEAGVFIAVSTAGTDSPYSSPLGEWDSPSNPTHPSQASCDSSLGLEGLDSDIFGRSLYVIIGRYELCPRWIHGRGVWDPDLS
ncbi:hypothetical protein Ancab_037570 [Ancistrocladus abbreviatus]